MSDPYRTREVEFNEFCKHCEHYDKEEWEDPCWECLENPVNVNSRVPTKFKEFEGHDGNKRKLKRA